MRSSVSHMLSVAGGEAVMSHPDYPQHAHHHAALLVLVKASPGFKPRAFQRVWDRLSRINNVKITDSTGVVRDIWVRYVREHPVENNDWGDFQTHRRLLGLITVGKYESQMELNEICRLHESLKVKYTSTLFDSRCILFGPSKHENIATLTEGITKLLSNLDDESNANKDVTEDNRLEQSTPETYSAAVQIDSPEQSSASSTSSSVKPEMEFTTPSNFKTRALFYGDNDPCVDLESQMAEFINSLFWVLESKRLERSREKIDKVALLLAPFEKKDFVGLDLESRNNRKRCMGRVTKHLADLTLQAGLTIDSLTLYQAASDTLKTVNDWLWLGAAYEGLCAASSILLFPNTRYTLSLQRNASLQEGSPQKNRANSVTLNSDITKQLLHKKSLTNVNDPVSKLNAQKFTESTDESLKTDSLDTEDSSIKAKITPQHMLQADDFDKKYRDAIIHYSKYQNAGIIEIEASFKAARIFVEQNHCLQAASFLQNVVFINLTLSEQERIQRFETLSDLYQQIGFTRKAAFCQRLAATRYVSQNNQNPDWAQCYQLMLDSFVGHKLSLEPTEVVANEVGWPALQIQLIQQLVISARRMGHPALATRHMTFLLQAMWNHLTPTEQRDYAIQLQNLSSQCEGAPVPLVLDNGTVIPPANLTDLPYCKSFALNNLLPHVRPQKVEQLKQDTGPFLFTPIHFGSMDRKNAKPKSKMEYHWVQNDLCEVTLKLINPLPFELKVSNMRLLTNGIVFESLPQTIILPPETPTIVSLKGTPLEHGELEILGYSTHTLGVKSNCRLKNMLKRHFLPMYSVDVIPVLPTMDVKTSLPQTATFSNFSNFENVVTSASVSLYNGEQAECTITLTNTSTVPIEFLEVSMQSDLEINLQNKIFKWSDENLQSQLPIQPDCSASFTLYLYGETDFLGPILGNIGAGGTLGHIGVPSFYSGSVVTNSGHGSLPSRVSSPTTIGRRSELSSSFRSSASGHSSLVTLSLPPQGSGSSRSVFGQMGLRYGGGPGFECGYCRHCALYVALELLPSVQITHWDVLPAETPSQFYLVLDVLNLTVQEMSLQYTPSKNILIEAGESCRVPVPVDRCPLEIASEEAPSMQIGENSLQSSSLPSCSIVSVDKTCSDHIASRVDLRWHLPGTASRGRASLKGICLDAHMLDLVRVAPLQWEVTLNSQPLRPQEDYSCPAGECIKVGVSIVNHLPRPLSHLSLSVSFYQDHQNGINNYRLETRVASSGANKILLPPLLEQGRAHHECSVVFFTPGRYKADIQCTAPQQTQIMPQIMNHIMMPGQHSHNHHELPAHVWRFIPPLEITVID